MIRHVLTGDLTGALAERQAAFLAGSEAEEWLLPPGEHTFDTGLQLGAPGRTLAVVGAGINPAVGSNPGTRLVFTAGGLALQGDWVRLSTLEVSASDTSSAGADGAAIALQGKTLEVLGVRCTARGDDVVALRALGEDEVIVADFGAHAVRGQTRARGVFARARAVEVTSVSVRDIAADSTDGLVLVALHGGSLLALDLTVTELRASTGLGRAIVACSGGSSSLRGFSVNDARGTACHGLVLVGTAALEVTSGRVNDLVGSSAGAVGVRVLLVETAASSNLGVVSASAVSITDISVSALGGVNPLPDAAPHPDVAAWAAEIGARLALDATLDDVPEFPSSDAQREVVGVHVGAFAAQLQSVWSVQPHALRLEDLVVHRVAGTALQVEAGLRAAELRRIELWLSARAGWLQAENILLAEATVHQHLQPLRLGPGSARIFDVILSGSPANASPVLDEEAELHSVGAAFVLGGSAPWTALDEQPYVEAGPSAPPTLSAGVVPPPFAIDLSLASHSELLDAAQVVDGETPAFVGARAPDVPLPCHLDDPEPRVWQKPPPNWPEDPPVDYRARDAASLLDVMTERARVTMVPWTSGDAADFPQMLFELLAERLDHASYEQERAVAEGFLDSARLRRSVEDHARALDYQPDQGSSATTLLRVMLDRDALAHALASPAVGGVVPASELQACLDAGRPVEIAAGTLVGNSKPEERSIVFCTQEHLSYLPELDVVTLASSLAVGAHSARLVGRLQRLRRGRWLIVSRGSAYPGLVVRVTSAVLETDTTLVTWDPRRAAEHVYPAEGEQDRAVVFGNVVPAHHGLPIDGRYDAASESELDRALARWNAQLTLQLDGARVREFELPVRPSIQATGYPFPGERRKGLRVLGLAVDGDTWTEVDDLSLAGPGDEVFVVRAAPRGLPVVRFGDGINGAALPARRVQLQLQLTVGGGAGGNVGARTLTQVLRFGRALSPATDPEGLILPTPSSERSDYVRRIWTITNPLPAVGGRDPEALESVRYKAPLGVRDALSAVAPGDYEALLLRLPYVAGARARVASAGPREVIRVTVLLRDEDTLPEPELLRRWALVRQKLEEVRLLGFDVEAVPPLWVPLDLDLVVEAAPLAVRGQVRSDVSEALAGNGGMFDPDTTGLGGDVRLSDLYERVQRVSGVHSVRVVRFRRLERGAREHLHDGVIPIGDHEVASVGGPRAPGKGLVTLSVCGGLA